MPRRGKLSIGPAFQQITDIALESIGNWRCIDPVTGAVQQLQPAKIILLQSRQYAKISVGGRTRTLCLDIILFERRKTYKLATAKWLVIG